MVKKFTVLFFVNASTPTEQNLHGKKIYSFIYTSTPTKPTSTSYLKKKSPSPNMTTSPEVEKKDKKKKSSTKLNKSLEQGLNLSGS